MKTELIVKRNYSVEIHNVTTKTGYILELHRIPPAVRDESTKVVFLQHGLVGTSAQWVFNKGAGENKNLSLGI